MFDTTSPKKSCACHLPEVVRKYSRKQYSLAMPLVIEIAVNGVFKFKEDIASAPAIGERSARSRKDADTGF